MSIRTRIAALAQWVVLGTTVGLLCGVASAVFLRLLESATAAREANELAQQRYQSGNIDFIAALDAQRTVLGLEESFIATRLDRSIAFVQLYKALGGGWASH